MRLPNPGLSGGQGSSLLTRTWIIKVGYTLCRDRVRLRLHRPVCFISFPCPKAILDYPAVRPGIRPATTAQVYLVSLLVFLKKYPTRFVCAFEQEPSLCR
jgi:hypothetical protein